MLKTYVTQYENEEKVKWAEQCPETLYIPELKGQVIFEFDMMVDILVEQQKINYQQFW